MLRSFIAETPIGVPKPEPGEIAERSTSAFGAVGLVGDQDRLDALAAEQRRDLLVGAGQPVLRVDDEQHQVRPRHRQLDLVA